MGAPQQGQTKVGAAGRCVHGAAPFKDEADCLAFNVGSHQPLPTGTGNYNLTQDPAKRGKMTITGVSK